MASRVMTSENFASLIESGTVVVEFWAPWCPPCRAFARVFGAAAALHPEIAFATVNTESEPGLAAAFRIHAVPTVMVFRDGILLFAEPGTPSSDQLDAILTKLATVDMEELRERIRARESTKRDPGEEVRP